MPQNLAKLHCVNRPSSCIIVGDKTNNTPGGERTKTGWSSAKEDKTSLRRRASGHV